MGNTHKVTKPRRQQGGGSIDTLPSGKHRVRVTVEGRRESEVFPTVEEAEAFKRAVVVERRADAAKKLPAERKVETVATWAERWLKRRRDLKLVRWPRVDETRWKQYVEGTPLASLPLADVRPRDVQAFVDGLMKRPGEPLDTATITRVVALVRKSFSDAERDERVVVNPARRVEIPKRGNVKADTWTFLTADEVRAVEACEAMPGNLRLLFVVAIYTGLRAGELWALRWADVDTAGATPTVTVRASHGNAPKNGKVQRVPLLPAAREAFEQLRILAGEVQPDDLVFPAPRGGQRQRGDDAGWNTRKVRGKPHVGLRELAGITRPVHFHACRHTFASHLIMGTWTDAPLPLAEVRVLMRHGSVAMTERYAHLAPEHLHARLTRAAPQRPVEAAPVPAEAPDAARTTPAPAPPVEAGAAVTNGRDQLPPFELVTPSPRPSRNPYSTAVGRVGIEPTTDGLKVRRSFAEIPGDFSGRDQPMTDSTAGEGRLRALALDLLGAVDEGRPAGPVARDLAVEVLRQLVPDSAGWAKALDVLEGGALRVRRAVDLAGLVLDAIEMEEQQEQVVRHDEEEAG